MGASMALANNPSYTSIKNYNNNNTVSVDINSTPPDYKFEHFMKRCQQIQEQKKTTQLHIRMEVYHWKERARNGADTNEIRQRIMGLLSQFRELQQKQDELVQKEKMRLDVFRNAVNADTTNRIRSRLDFFCKLNKQHEGLLELVKQDVQECRMLIKKYQDTPVKESSESSEESDDSPRPKNQVVQYLRLNDSDCPEILMISAI